MKLNTGLIAHSLPFQPEFLCGSPDHALNLSDIRFLQAEGADAQEDILYFSEWEKLGEHTTPLPVYMFCAGGGAEAAAFFEKNGMTGIIAGGQEPIAIFSAIQNVFLRYNKLEIALAAAIRTRAPARDILNCCAEFFQNHTILFDSERKLVDYSTNYLPDEDDLYWKQTLEAGRRPDMILSEARKNAYYKDHARTPNSDLMDLGPRLPRILTYSFFEGGKRLTTLTVVEKNKPLSVCQLKLLDSIGSLIPPELFHTYSSPLGHVESLRAVLLSQLSRENVDPLLMTRCIETVGWKTEDNYVLFLISFPEASRNAETLTRYRHIYERFFPECVAFQFNGSLVLIVHNDTGEVMAASLPNLEKQLELHSAVCGLSYPFKGIHQIQYQYQNAEIAIHHGDTGKRIRLLSDTITGPIVSRIAAAIPLYPLCHREAVRIYEYDQENATELLLTLETYLLQYKSLKAAADRLYIHRNTMTYRLGCIEKLTKLTLDDPQERLHILLSCIVLRTLGKPG